MDNVATVPVRAARHIARSAQRQIKNITGMQVTLLMCQADDSLKTPEHMLRVIAFSLNMSPRCYKMKTRARHIVELRFIGAMLLRMHYPRITLQQITILFGGLDHSSILSGLARANNLIYTGDARFIKKYNTALKSVNLWLRKGV